MLQGEDLTITYGQVPLFQGATFAIQRGERCGLVGRNGTGKSTILRLIVGRESADSGRIIIPKGYRIGFLDQHIRFTHLTIMEEALSKVSLQQYQMEEMLGGLGFTEAMLDSDPQKLSGGYQLRLHLAKVLGAEPDCLLLDEPTNYLDILSIRWLSSFLKQWKGEFILITHDREFMDSVTTHTMGIHRHKVHKVEGSTEKYFEQLAQAELVHERARQKLEKKKEHLTAYIERFGAKASKATQAQSKQKMLDRMPALEQLKDLYGLQFHFNEAPFNGRKMVEAEEVTFGYNSLKTLIEKFSLLIEKKDRVAIIGKNGIGKSTLLRLLAQDLEPISGTVVQADPVRLGYFGQTNIDRLHPNHTIEQEVSEANPKLNFTQVKAICGLMMFSGDLSEKPVSVLSGGERSRVLLAKILAHPCNLLFLDEPTHHLDMESIEALIDALEEFDGSVVIVTHSELILHRLNLNKIIVCHPDKQQFFLGTYGDFLEKQGWAEESKLTIKPKKKDAAQKKQIDQELRLCEKEILKLETEQQKDEADLANRMQAGERNVQELVKKIKQRKKSIDDKFEELERLYTALNEDA